MEREPISQAWMIELMEQMENRVDGGHSRVRQSLNELRTDMRSGFARVADKQEAIDARLGRHSEKILVIETARSGETKHAAELAQRNRDWTAIVAASSSAVVTIGLFVIKALLHL